MFSLRNPCLDAGHSRKHKRPILGKDLRKKDHVPSKGKCNALVWTIDNDHMPQYYVLQFLCTVQAETAGGMQ